MGHNSRAALALVAGLGSAWTVQGQVIFDNGPFITSTGTGRNGNNVSEVQAGFGTAGFNCNNNNFIVCDDFIVPGGSRWQVSSMVWYAYQTQTEGADNTTSTFTGAYVQIYNGNPALGGTQIAGDTTTNRLTGSAFAGAYRIFTGTAQTGSARAIMANTINMSWVPPLEAGHYWVAVTLTGTVASGPWTMAITPQRSTDNSVQKVVAQSAWQHTQDATSLQVQDAAFKLNGTVTVSAASAAPSGEGRAAPEAGNPGDQILLTVAVSPGANPVSTGVTVSIDLASIGLTAAETMFDDGSNGDAVGGDGVYSLLVTLPTGATPGSKLANYTVRDAQLRSSSMGLTFGVADAESNDTKETATAVTVAPGGSFGGLSTGALTSGAASSLDNFRVKTTPAAPGIYRQRLSINSALGANAMTATLRGLTQTAGVINAGTDATFQTGAVVGGVPRVVQYYGFGLEEEIIYRASGAAASTTGYNVTLTRDAMTPTAVANNIIQGTVTFTRTAGNTTAVDMWLYDGAFNAMVNGGNAGNNSLTASLTPGTYYLALADANTANNLASPVGDANQAGNVLDFPNAIANSSATAVANLNMTITYPGGSAALTGGKAGAFDIVWYRLNVVAPTVSTPPSGLGAISPGRGMQGVVVPAVLTVTTAPGLNPTSTSLTVQANLTQVGGSATQQLFDNGTNGDATANDGVFTYAFNLPATLTGGDKSIAFTVTDNLARSSGGTVTYTVIPVTDLGTVGPSNPTIAAPAVSYGANGVVWYKLTVAGDAGAPCTYVDMYNRGSTAGTGVDVEMGLYRTDGTLVASNDDWNGVGPSMLTFGRTTPTRLYNTPGTFVWTLGANGVNGALPAGTYFIAMGSFNVNFNATNFDVQATSANTGVMQLTVQSDLNTGPIPPTAGSATAGGVTIGLPGVAATTSITVAAGSGCNPPSGSLTAQVDLLAVGGPANQTMYDDGTNGDLTPGDNIFTYEYALPISVTAGTYTLPVTVTDDLSRTAAAGASLVVRGVIDIGPVSAAVSPVSNTAGSIGANQVQWYRLTTSSDATDPTGYLDISLQGTLLTPSNDPEIGIFDSLGNFVATDDDSGDALLSQLSFGTTLPTRPADGAGLAFSGQNGALPAGTYYIAVCSYNGAFATPYSVTGQGANAGAITVRVTTDLTGGSGGGCNLADITGIGGPPSLPDGQLTGDDFVAFTNAFGNGDLLADITGIGGPPSLPDGQLTGDDFVAFTNAFGAGCP